MSDNPQYDACIAAGGSPAVCAATFGGPGEDEGDELAGQTLYDLQGNLKGRLVRVGEGREGYTGSGTRPQPGLYLFSGMGKTAKYTPFAAGSYLMDAGLGKRYHVTLDKGANILQSSVSTAPTGSSRAAPAYSSTSAAQEDQQAHDREMTALSDQLREAQAARDYKRARELEIEILDKQQKFQAGENLLTRENKRRMALSGELSAIAQTAASIRQQYRSDLMGLEQTMKLILGETLGKDVVRGAIQSTGQVQRGVTPMGAFRTDVGGVAKSAGALAGQLEGPLPTPNLGADIPGLESQMPQYQEWMTPPDLPQLPTAPVFGLLHGGEVAKGGKEKGQITPFAERPDPRTSLQYAEQMGLTPRIVGEREGGPELALLAPGSKVIPLSDEEEAGLLPMVQGAAQGADLPYDVSTMEQALSPIYEHLGFTGTPKTYSGAGGVQYLASGMGTSKGGALERLGARPRLVSEAETGTVFFVDPSGRRRHVGSAGQFTEFGFNWGDVVNIPGRELATMYPDVGSPLTQAPPLMEPGISERRFPSPGLIRMPLTEEELAGPGPGFALPAMRTIASLWSGLSAYVQDVITSAFGVAGINPAMMEAERRFFTPMGTARAPGAALIA